MAMMITTLDIISKYYIVRPSILTITVITVIAVAPKEQLKR